MTTTYHVTRFYRDDPSNNRIIRIGLTKAEAQAHCNDPETSSETATSDWAQQETEKYGPWFDGFGKDTAQIIEDWNVDHGISYRGY